MAPPPAPAVRVGDYPQLRTIAWHLTADTQITEVDALHIYERNWRFVTTPTDAERRFIQHLADTYSHGKLLV